MSRRESKAWTLAVCLYPVLWAAAGWDVVRLLG